MSHHHQNISIRTALLFQIIVFILADDPILIASPYPFNTSKSSHIQCFSHDESIIFSLTIIATMSDMSSTLQSTKDNLIHNESVVLTIPVMFNYSQLHSKIECRSSYHHGPQKFSLLEVFSVAEIPDNSLQSMNALTNQIATIHCLTYGTDVCMQKKSSLQTKFCKNFCSDSLGFYS